MTRPFSLLLTAVALWGCGESNVLVWDRSADAGVAGGAEICTQLDPQPGQPEPQNRCFEAPCYSSQSAPANTVAQAIVHGTGLGIPVQVDWDGRYVGPGQGIPIGSFPDRRATITASGSGCYDCPETVVGNVSHAIGFDPSYAMRNGTAIYANQVGLECVLLSRPEGAIPQVTQQRMVDAIEACIAGKGLGDPHGEHFDILSVWGLHDFDEETVQQRSDLGDCLALTCAQFNTFEFDRDGDQVGDACDNCVDPAGVDLDTHNPDQSNVAGTWLGDACEDTDGDGARDDIDNCAHAANANQADFDGNGVGDACDDRDGDGVVDAQDPCPERAGPCQDDYSDDFGACEVQGSIVGVETQTLGETIDLPGTGLHLRYASQRVPGFTPSGAPERDARDFGFGGWTLNAQHHWEGGDPPRILLGAGGNFPVTRQFLHPDGTLVPDPSDAIAYVFDDAQRHTQTLDAIDGRVLARFEYDGDTLTAVVDAFDQRVTLEQIDGEIVITGPFDDINRLAIDPTGYLASVTQPGDRLWQVAHDEGGLLEALAPPRVSAAGGPARHRFIYNEDGQLVGDQGVDGERLRLRREIDGAVSTVNLYRALDLVDGQYVELHEEYVSQLDGRRSVEFANRRNSTQALTEGELEGFVSGHRTVDPDGGKTTVLIDDGDRWAGGISRGRVRFEPPENTELADITVDTEEHVVLAADGPLGERSVASISTTIRQNGTIRGRSALYPSGDGFRFDARPFLESSSAEGRVSQVVMTDGRVVEVHAGELYPVRYTYDDRGRVASVRQGEGDDERVTQVEYFDDGNTVLTTGPSGRQMATTLNDALDLARVENLTADSALTFEYDDGGALDRLNTPSGAHAWTASDGGRVQSYTAPPVAGQPDGSTTRYTWTRDGRPASVTEADGRETGFVYDSTTGLPTRIETPEQTITQRWNDALRPHDTQLSVRTLADGTRVTITERPLYVGSRVTGEAIDIRVNGELKTIRQTARVDLATWQPTQLVIEDAADGLKKAKVTFDDDGLLTRMGDMTINRAARGVGLPGTIDIGQTQIRRDFSRFAEMDAKHIDHGGDLRYLLELHRDPRSGEVTGVRECFIGAGGCETWRFEHDARGQLTLAKPDNGASFSYEYDASGRRTRRGHGASDEVTQLADAQDRLLGYGDASFGYNAMGQRVAAVDTPTGDWTYDYDVNGGLRQVDGDGVRVEYVLDSAGRRIARREDDGPLTWWMHAGLQPVAEFDAELRLRKRFFYGVEGHVPEYMTVHDAAGAETGRYHFVTNLVGSVVGVLDDDGEWVERTNYTPFGRPEIVIAAPEGLRHPFGFAGGIKDEATGLVRFGARDYDPFTGVWLAKDPIGFAGGDANLYGYVGNDPVRFFDPSGLVRWEGQGPWCAGGRDRFGGPCAMTPTWAVNAVKVIGLFAIEEIAMNYATGGAFTLGKWALRGVRKLMRARKARKVDCAVEAISTGPITDSSHLLPAPRTRGNANPLGEQGPFRLTPDGQAVPPIGKFNPGSLVRHPRTGKHGKMNFGTRDPVTGKFKEKVAVHPREPGKGSRTHAGQDHFHLDRDKNPIYAP